MGIWAAWHRGVHLKWRQGGLWGQRSEADTSPLLQGHPAHSARTPRASHCCPRVTLGKLVLNPSKELGPSDTQGRQVAAPGWRWSFAALGAGSSPRSCAAQPLPPQPCCSSHTWGTTKALLEITDLCQLCTDPTESQSRRTSLGNHCHPTLGWITQGRNNSCISVPLATRKALSSCHKPLQPHHLLR